MDSYSEKWRLLCFHVCPWLDLYPTGDYALLSERQIGENVRRAIDDTWGEVLTFEGELCDTRFSKCCGGLTERFSTCWEDVDYPYLTRVEDPFCNTSDESVLSQVLNDYDLETKDFYRWEVQYGKAELAALISERSGCDIGDLLALEPLERGVSGRIKLLRIVGSTRGT